MSDIERKNSFAEAAAQTRKQARTALIEQQDHEFAQAHDGSGRSEEMPADLAQRHREQWQAFERRYPAPRPGA